MIESIFRNVHITQISAHAETLITKFLRVISLDKMSCGLVCKITSFFKHIMLSNGKPLKLNQDLILDEMLSMTNRSKVELFDARRYRVDLQYERAALIKEFIREGNLELTIHSPEIANAKLREHLLLYHAECIEILALCCVGPNNSISSSRCMPVLPLEILLKVLSNRDSYKCVAVANSYGLFFRHVYLSPGWLKLFVMQEEVPTELIHYEPLWQSLSHFCGIIGDDLKSSKMHRSFIFNVAIPCLDIVLSSITQDQSDTNTILSANTGGRLDIISLSTKRSLAALLNDANLNVTEKIIVSSAATSLGVTAFDFASSGPRSEIHQDPIYSPDTSIEMTPMLLSHDPTLSPTLVSENLPHLQNLIRECPVLRSVL